MIKLSTYLKQYRVGDIVDIKANAAVQKGYDHPIPGRDMAGGFGGARVGL